MKRILLVLFIFFTNNSLAETRVNESIKLLNYSCKNGFQLEKIDSNYQCVQPAKISYRALQNCVHHTAKNGIYELKVDQIGKEDRCVKKIGIKSKLTGNVRTVILDDSFKPNCQSRYSLKVRRGKDACSKLKPKIIFMPLLTITPK